MGGPPLAGEIDYEIPRQAGHRNARSARDRASSGGETWNEFRDGGTAAADGYAPQQP